MVPILQRLLGRRAASAVPETKTSRTGPLVALHQAGRPVWTPRDYAALAREGFQRNAVVYRAVRMLAEAAASVPWTVFDGDREAPDHPVAELLMGPNPRQGGPALFEALYGHLLVAGNAYCEAVSLGGRPRELYALRPDRMKVVPGLDGWPEAYEYTLGADRVRFPMDGEGVAPILHLTLFHPVDDHYGLPPLEPAALALDIHNAAGAWHKALLDNAARPSGALVYSGPQGAPLSDEQFARLKEELEASIQGAANAGRPLLLEGGLDWKQLSLSPRDMDFVEAKAAAAREIALALGVPPLLLGLPGDNTYANYAEAQRGFWRQSVIPLATRTAQDVARWLAPAFGSGLRLEPDLDRIDALAAEREALWRRIDAASFLDEDEKRAAVGYGPRAIAPSMHKGGWAGLDVAPGDVVGTGGGYGVIPCGGQGWGGESDVGFLGGSDVGGGSEHWRNQPRVAAGNGEESGRWTAEGVVDTQSPSERTANPNTPQQANATYRDALKICREICLQDFEDGLIKEGWPGIRICIRRCMEAFNYVY